MSCNPELVSAFLDGELDDVILETVTRHLLKCETCCQMLGKLAQVRDALRERFAFQDAESFTAGVMAAINNEQVHHRATTPIFFHPLGKALHQRLVRFGLPAALAAVAMNAWVQHEGETVAHLAPASGQHANAHDESGKSSQNQP